MLSQLQAQLYITDPKTMHQALQRNGYYAPRLKSQLMSFEFMDGVREGRYWLPLMTDCRLMQIASCPPLKVLAEILVPLIEADANSGAYDGHPTGKAAMLATAARIRKLPPDSAWMISLIYSLRPDHEIFQKDYVVPKKTRNTLLQQSEIDNSSGFFNNLPLSKSKGSGRAILGVRRLSKIEREEKRIAELNARIQGQRQRYEEELQKCQQRIQDEQMQQQMMSQVKRHGFQVGQDNTIRQGSLPKSPSPSLRQNSRQPQTQEKRQRSRRVASKSPNTKQIGDDSMQY